MRNRMAPVALLVAALLGASSSAALDDGGTSPWEDHARDALARFATEDDGDQTPHAYAFAAWTVGLLDGWDDPDAAGWLEKVYDLELPQGGWGLGYDRDAFSNGIVNPADTIYTVTTVGHVGRVLIDGYDNDAVPGDRIQSIVDLVLDDIPRVPDHTPGVCLSYSEHAHDADEGCVYNVNAQVGWFLHAAMERGFTHPDLLHTVAGITSSTAAAYDHPSSWWQYGDSQRMDYTAGQNHHSSKTLAMLELAPPLGADAARSLYGSEFVGDRDVLAHVRVAARSDDGCERAKALVCPLGSLVASEADPRVQAQLAAGAAGIVAACSG